MKKTIPLFLSAFGTRLFIGNGERENQFTNAAGLEASTKS